jgi:heat-inducible transcriptional repressor
VQLPAGLTNSALTQASNYLANIAVGRTLAEARAEVGRQRAQRVAELDELTQRLVDTGLATLSEGSATQAPTVIVRGRSNLLNDAMESEELKRMRRLFDELEQQEGLIELLGEAEQAEGVRIFIGSENKLFSLSGSSLIVAPYRDEDDRIVGAVGVIGPTRLNYARIVPMVDYTAQLISRLSRPGI